MVRLKNKKGDKKKHKNTWLGCDVGIVNFNIKTGEIVPHKRFKNKKNKYIVRTKI